MDKTLASVAAGIFMMLVALYFARLLWQFIKEQATANAVNPLLFCLYAIWATSIVALVISLALSMFLPQMPALYWQIPGVIALACFVTSWFTPKLF